MTRVDPDLPDLTGTVALVTGASGGIGSGIAARFATAGAAVVLHYGRGREAAEALATELRTAGAQAKELGADLTDADACQDAKS